MHATDCKLHDNGASGLWALGGARVRLARCAVVDNECNGAAIWDVGASALLRDCRFVGNKQHGVRLLHGSGAALRGCVLEDNYGHALEVGGSARGELDGCALSGALLPPCRRSPFVHRPACVALRAICTLQTQHGPHVTILCCLAP